MSNVIINPYVFAEPAFVPTDISGLQLWLDASDTSTITEAGGSVSQWDDKSGNSNNVVQGTAAKQPTTGTRTLNSLNVLDFDGGDNMTVTLPSVISQPGTIFVVGQFDLTGTAQYFYDSVTAANRVLAFRQSTDVIFMFAGASLTKAGETSVAPYLIACEYNTTSSELVLNGVSAASGNAGSNSFQSFKLGSRYTDASYLDGFIAEFLFYDSVLSVSDYSSVQTFLSDKWGLGL